MAEMQLLFNPQPEGPVIYENIIGASTDVNRALLETDTAKIEYTDLSLGSGGDGSPGTPWGTYTLAETSIESPSSKTTIELTTNDELDLDSDSLHGYIAYQTQISIGIIANIKHSKKTTFIQQTALTMSNLCIFNGSKFVASKVGLDSVQTSPDGIAWSSVDVPVSFSSVTALTVMNEDVYIGGTTGEIAVSTNSAVTAFTDKTAIPGGGQIDSLANNGTIIVAIVDVEQFWVSDDLGSSWTLTFDFGPTPTNFYTVRWCFDKFVAVGHQGTGSGAIITSIDGVTWDAVINDSGEITTITAGYDTLGNLIYGAAGQDGLYGSSPDLETWAMGTLTVSAGSSAEIININELFYILYTHVTNSKLYYATGADNYDTYTLIDKVFVSDICFGKGFLMLASVHAGTSTIQTGVYSVHAESDLLGVTIDENSVSLNADMLNCTVLTGLAQSLHIYFESGQMKDCIIDPWGGTKSVYVGLIKEFKQELANLSFYNCLFNNINLFICGASKSPTTYISESEINNYSSIDVRQCTLGIENLLATVKFKFCNNGSLGYEAVIDSSIQADVSANITATFISGCLWGSGANLQYGSNVLLIDPKYKSLTDYRLKRLAEGDNENSKLIHSSSFEKNSVGQKRDFGCYNVDDIGIVDVMQNKIILPIPYKVDGIERQKIQSSSEQQAISGVVTVQQNVKQKMEALIYHWRSLSQKNLADLDLLESVNDNRVELLEDPAVYAIVSDFTNDGGSSIGDVQIQIDSQQVFPGTVIKVDEIDYHIILAIPTYLAATKIIIHKALQDSIANNDPIKASKPSGYGEYKRTALVRTTTKSATMKKYERGAALRVVRQYPTF